MKVKRITRVIAVAFAAICSLTATGQTEQKVKISGYVQAQYQWGEPDAQLKVGGANENPTESFSRFGLRRARLRAAYNRSLVDTEIEVNMTEKGLSLVDLFVQVRDPWQQIATLRAGQTSVNFGYELSHPSVTLESLEKSLYVNLLFPEEKDLGLLFMLSPFKTSYLKPLQLSFSVMSGNGPYMAIDNKVNVSARLSTTSLIEVADNVEVGGGVSAYFGQAYQGSRYIYNMKNGVFAVDSSLSNRGGDALRRYYGAHLRLRFANPLGRTELRGEYVWGQQPGNAAGSRSYIGSSLPVSDTYIRPFRSSYAEIIHDIKGLPLSAVVKYDYFDPNTDINVKGLHIEHSSIADAAISALGVGMLWEVYTNLQLQAWYEINKTEKSDAFASPKGNIFTARCQYKF
jgi:hypothetical protein